MSIKNSLPAIPTAEMIARLIKADRSLGATKPKNDKPAPESKPAKEHTPAAPSTKKRGIDVARSGSEVAQATQAEDRSSKKRGGSEVAPQAEEPPRAAPKKRRSKENEPPPFLYSLPSAANSEAASGKVVGVEGLELKFVRIRQAGRCLRSQVDSMSPVTCDRMFGLPVSFTATSESP